MSLQDKQYHLQPAPRGVVSVYRKEGGGECLLKLIISQCHLSAAVYFSGTSQSELSDGTMVSAA